MAEIGLESGDLVRRDDQDIWRIVSIPDVYDPLRDRARCECVRAPLGWLRPDGTRSKPWARVGSEHLLNIADLVRLPADALDSPDPAERRAAAEAASAAARAATPTAAWSSESWTLAPIAAGTGEAGLGDSAGQPDVASWGEDDQADVCQPVVIDQTRGPELSFEARRLCAYAADAESDEPLRAMTIYETRAGTLVAVAVSRAAGPDSADTVRAAVIAVGEDPQAAHFAVLDHFDWDPRARAMVADRLGWSLRREIA